MGRLINADELLHCDCKDSFSECDTCLNSELCSLINDAQTIEAIPKADYEARLKADMVAILTELDLEVDKIEILKSIAREDINWNMGAKAMREKIKQLIQERIDALEGEENEQTN